MIFLPYRPPLLDGPTCSLALSLLNTVHVSTSYPHIAACAETAPQVQARLPLMLWTLLSLSFSL